MINHSALHHHYQSLASTTQANTALPVLPIQQQAMQYIQQHKLPHRKIEAWHYTALNPLFDHAFASLDEDVALHDDDIAHLVLGETDGIRIVLYNGCYQAHLSHIPDRKGLHIESLNVALARGDKTVMQHLGTLSGETEHWFSALNTAMLHDGVVIKIAAQTVIKQPIELLNISLTFAEAHLSQPRNMLIVEAGASATVVESYAAIGDTLCFNNSVTEVFLAEKAQLSHQRLQNESQHACHLACLYVQQGKASRYIGTTASLGALWSRTEFHIELVGEQADCQLSGLYLAGDHQVSNNHLNVAHRAPHCTSREFFKGIVNGHGRAVFDGSVIVHPDAQHTDAHLNNANLLLSRDAEIATKPVLEINADDVQCSHGTTVGQIDQAMLFYLRSRGLSEAQAQQMICQGFIAEILERFQWQPLRDHLDALLEQRLLPMGHSQH